MLLIILLPAPKTEEERSKFYLIFFPTISTGHLCYFEMSNNIYPMGKIYPHQFNIYICHMFKFT